MFLSPKKLKSTDIPTSALSDMVFLLLVFFLVTTTIDAEKGIGLVLPGLGERPPVDRDNLAYIWINSASEVAFEGNIVEIENITELMIEKLQKRPKAIASVKTDRSAKYDIYIDVVDKLKKAWGDKPARISIADE